MSRPRNEEAENEIRAAAFKLLLDEGYSKASYQGVADTTGYSRAFIQHYFPKKESFLTSFLESLLAECDSCVEKLRDTREVNVLLLLTGQLYFSFLADPRHRALALDVLENRKLTELAIDYNQQYEANRTQATEAQKTAASDGLIRVIGGSYEMVFYKLNSNRPVDAFSESLYVVEGWQKVSGVADGAFHDKALEARLSDDEVADSLRTIRKNLVR